MSAGLLVLWVLIAAGVAAGITLLWCGALLLALRVLDHLDRYPAWCQWKTCANCGEPVAGCLCPVCLRPVIVTALVSAVIAWLI